MKGKLYLVPTPIGNLRDITLRAVDVLQSVDIIACEDTRHTLKLLNHLNIKKKLISYFEHSKREKGEYIISKIEEGLDVAFVSDAGTPAISDPGEELVKVAIEKQIQIVPLPGAVALTTGLIGSGLFTSRFVFDGFLPVNKRAKRLRIEEIRNEKRTVILYEAPHKIVGTLKLLLEMIGDRKIVLARELTKKFEEFHRTTIEESLKSFVEKPPKGEFVLLIEGFVEETNLDSNESNEIIDIERVKQKIKEYVDGGLNKKDAIKKLSKEMNLPKRSIYKYSFDSTTDGETNE